MISLIETDVFVKQAETLMGERYLDELKNEIAINPKAGDVIANTGGMRKIRGRRLGAGKRGGVRVIYYVNELRNTAYLIYCVAKAGDKPLTNEQKAILRRQVHDVDSARILPFIRP